MESTPVTTTPLQRSLENVRASICRAAERAKTNPDDVEILAVTKTLGPDRLEAAWELGLTQFGESRVQEAEQKRAVFEKSFPLNRQPRWHLVGHLQSNKVRKALETFDCIQSVDSLKLIRLLNEEAERRAQPVSCLIEVKISEEPSKQGLPPESLGGFLDQCARLSFVRIEGLMGVAPLFADPQQTRPYFRALRTLFDHYRPFFVVTRPILSMGMSPDFEIAIEEGATMVRLGSVLFGPRA